MNRLDPSLLSDQVLRFKRDLDESIVGQDHAIEELVGPFSRLTSGIRNPERPVLTLLLVGPTGVGKTETVRALANTLFGSIKAFTRVNCQEFSSPHQVAKLLGSPPGYIGSDIEPMLSQNNIDRHHREAFTKKLGIFRGSGHITKFFPGDESKFLSLVLFDEIEKADPVLWNSLLGILDDGNLSLGSNQTVDFTRAIIILTSNVGSREMSELIRGRIGFNAAEDTALDQDIRQEAIKAARAVFPFEFLNRIDATIVYQTLREQHLLEILKIYLKRLHARMVASEIPFILECSHSALRFIVREGTDPEFGARPLARAFSRNIVNPLSNLLSTKQVRPGDFLHARLRDGKVIFERESRKKQGILVAKNA
jgi:ATP-dependent Clp protease ATP-binding subunit ClpA